MIGQNIQAARKAKGLSQEELAVRLNVVRQTVSKWEKGLSAPDADQLVLLAHALETPVDRLLGIPPQELSGLEEERERILQEFSLYRQRDARRALLERKRGRLLALSFAAMLAALAVRRPVVSLLLTGGCALGALALLYKDLPLLTESAQEQKLPKQTLPGPKGLAAVRLTTVFDLVLLGLALGAALLELTGRTGESPWFDFLNQLRRQVPVVQKDTCLPMEGTAFTSPAGELAADIARWRQWSYYKLKYKEIRP